MRQVYFAHGHLGDKVATLLAKRVVSSNLDQDYILHSAYSNADLMPYAMAWEKGANLTIVRLLAAGVSTDIGSIVTALPVVVPGEPLNDAILAAVRVIVGKELAKRAVKSKIVISPKSQDLIVIEIKEKRP